MKLVRNRIAQILPLLLIAFVLGMSQAFGQAVDPIDQIVTDAGTLFGTVKTFVISVVVFIIGLAIVKMLRKK